MVVAYLYGVSPIVGGDHLQAMIHMHPPTSVLLHQYHPTGVGPTVVCHSVRGGVGGCQTVWGT